ncbi:MAG: preprotein translocase subunit SecG [Parcubacteria group bacterium]|jgi:protein translocase SecG subunit
MTEKILIISQIVVAVLLTASVLLQNRGSGLSATFGGDSGGYYTKRGFEKFLSTAAVVLGALFLILAVANIYITSKAI